MSTSYTALESKSIESLGVKAPTFSSDVVSLVSSTSFLWTLGITACVLAGAVIIGRGGIYSLQASEAGIRKRNEDWKRASLGLLGVFSLWLILYTLNKGLVMGDVGLEGLRVGNGTSGKGGLSVIPVVTPGSSTIQPGSGVTNTSCASTVSAIAAIKSQAVCGNTQCKSLNGCQYSKYSSMINAAAGNYGVDPKMLIVLMCKESSANPAAQNRNPNGTYDCGLMQINKNGACDASILDPQTNINAGAALLKGKIPVVNQVYPGFPNVNGVAVAGVFASYNCCSNGTVPNAESVDCNQSSGFPFTIPKWACPINPGEGTFNMCVVKNYACELTACLNSL